MVRPVSRALMALSALSLSAMSMTAPAAAQWTAEPSMIGDQNVTVVRGGESWVSLAWTAPSDMENFRIEVQEWQEGTELSYPGDQAAAGLRGDSTLSAGEIDTTSFLLHTTADTPDSFFIQVTAVWEFDGQTYRFSPGGVDVQVADPTDANSMSPDGSYSMLTGGASVDSFGDGANNWIELEFIGLNSTASDLRVTVMNGPEIYYPQRTFTSLHHDAYLQQGEVDVARFWIDPSLLDRALVEAGQADMTVLVDYTINGVAHTSEHPFSLAIN